MGTPDPGAFWRMIEEHNIVALFTAPTAFRAIRKEDPNGGLSEKIFPRRIPRAVPRRRAGRPFHPVADEKFRRPVIDHGGRPKPAGASPGNPMGLGLLPVKHGSPTVAMPGYQIDILDEGGKPVADGQMGTIAVKLPLPPGALPTLYQADDRFRDSYLAQFPGYYSTSDAGFRGHGPVTSTSWAAPTTSSMSPAIGSRPAAWRRCWRPTRMWRSAPLLASRIPEGRSALRICGAESRHGKIAGGDRKRVHQVVRDKIGPVAAFKLAVAVKRLPKTRSGKNSARHVKKIADHDEWAMPATIDDPAILGEIGEALKAHGV